MSESTGHTPSSLYKIDPLREDNWIPWKIKVEAILDDRGLDGHIDGTKPKPGYFDVKNPTEQEEAAIEKWETEDKKARTTITLLVHDTQAIHLSGAKTAKELWEQLKAINEPRGQAGILAWRRKLYGTRAKKSTDIPTHLNTMRQILETLHLMGDDITDREYKNALMQSLPRSWEQFLTIYTQPGTTASDLTSYELHAILLEEDRHRKDEPNEEDEEDEKRIARESENALTARLGVNRRKLMDRISGGKRCLFCKRPGHLERDCRHKTKKCTNCSKMGHMKETCWSPGGGQAGKGPFRRRGPVGSRGKVSANIVEDADTTESNEDMPMEDVAFTAQDEFEYVPNDEPDDRLSWYDWLVDSGTTSHVTKIRSAISDYVPLKSRRIMGISNDSLEAVGQGTVELVNNIGNKSVHFKLKDVLYVPRATNNLVSLSRLDKEGGHAKLGDGKMTLISKDGYQFAEAALRRGLYILNTRAKLHPIATAKHVQDRTTGGWSEWHRRFGHIAYSGLQRLNREHLVDGMTIDEHSPMPQCEACIKAKQTRDPFPSTSENRSELAGELIHSDVWGPTEFKSVGRSKYFISFIDNATRRCTIEFMKKKSQTTEKVIQHITYLKTRWDKHPKIFRVDNGTEYLNEELITWCRNHGIELQTTAPYSPEQNGVAERFNRTLMELATAMLIERNLPKSLWAEAVVYAAYLRNRAPTRALKDTTPEGAWTGTKPITSTST